MTNEQEFLSLCEKFGIVLEKRTVDTVDLKAPGAVSYYYINEQGRTGKQRGYGGFYSEWSFDADGNFVSVGAWE
ncbi:MAG TPA: hypothetical protein PKE16_17965 [Hyphomicrobium sp.]|nr:hypothetical protein [Hyphomicrobium sp.]